MTDAAWVTMAAVCGYVWGGALTLLAIALRREGRRPRDGSGARGA